MSVRIRKTKYCNTANLPTIPPSRRPNSAGHLDVIRIPLKVTHSDSAHVTKPMTNRLAKHLMLAASDACRSTTLSLSDNQPAKLAWSLGNWRMGNVCLPETHVYTHLWHDVHMRCCAANDGIATGWMLRTLTAPFSFAPLQASHDLLAFM